MTQFGRTIIMNRRLKAEISGLVQGVGFRYFAMRQALDAGISGYVRNLPDGSVEVVAEGEEGLLLSFLESLKKGPVGAVVDNVAVDWAEYTGEYQGFVISR